MPECGTRVWTASPDLQPQVPPARSDQQQHRSAPRLDARSPDGRGSDRGPRQASASRIATGPIQGTEQQNAGRGKRQPQASSPGNARLRVSSVVQPQKPAPCRPSAVDRRFSRVRFPVNVGLRSALRTKPLGHRVQADAGLESGPTEASRAGSAAGPASGPRSGQALPTYRALQQAAGADRAAPPHIYGSQCRSSSNSTSSTASGTTSMRSREPLVGHGGRGQRRRGSHAGGFSPTTRRRRRGAAEHCVNGLTREVQMPMAPTWVSRAVRRPSLADSARATAQQCRHGQVFLHTSAAGCALAPQERLEAGIPNVLKSTVATQAAPARTADTWPRRGQ